MTSISTYDFIKWQISHYTERLAQATRTEERSFLRRELHNLKKAPYDRDNVTVGRSADDSVLDFQTDLGCP